MVNWKALVAAVLICQLAGIIGSVFTFDAIPTWYAGLAKPSFAPPNWLFAPVWTTLYALMGIAAYLVYVSGSKLKQDALRVFGAQLALNALWSIAFFGMKNIALGLGIILVLWALIALAILKFSRISLNAAYLLVPYLIWVSFATILNYALLTLN